MERLTRDQLEHQTVSLLEHRHRYLCAASLSRGHVLDIACGVGYGAGILMANSAVTGYVGVDNDEGAVAEARIATLGEVSLVRGSALGLPFRDKTFDTIVSLETLEHLPNPARTCEEFKRVLRPDGLLIGSVPAADFEEFCVAQYGRNPFHLQTFSEARLMALLGETFPYLKIFTARIGLAAGLYDASGMLGPYYDRVVIEATNMGTLYGSYFFLASMRPQSQQAERAGVLSLGGSYYKSERLQTDRLLAAALSEERIAKIIQEKDQLIRERDKRIEITEKRLQMTADVLGARDQEIICRDALLLANDIKLEQAVRLVAAKIARIHSLEELADAAEHRLAHCVEQKREAEAAVESTRSDLRSTEDQLQSTKAALEMSKHELDRIRNSRAWRMLCRLTRIEP